jgi:hypothetical protein
MEEWLLIKGFYHGLTQKAREQLDTTTGGHSWKNESSYGKDN